MFSTSLTVTDIRGARPRRRQLVVLTFSQRRVFWLRQRFHTLFFFALLCFALFCYFFPKVSFRFGLFHMSCFSSGNSLVVPLPPRCAFYVVSATVYLSFVLIVLFRFDLFCFIFCSFRLGRRRLHRSPPTSASLRGRRRLTWRKISKYPRHAP